MSKALSARSTADVVPFGCRALLSRILELLRFRRPFSAATLLVLAVAVPGFSTRPAAGQDPAPGFWGSEWRYIVIHHSASPSGNAASFDRAHRSKGWDGLGYHFVIGNGKGSPDGELTPGERWVSQKHGAHAGHLPSNTPKEERNAYNEFGIGICLVGNFQKSAPTARQMETLKALVTQLRADYGISTENIVGHRHVNHTLCPGKSFPWGRLFAALDEPDVRPRKLPRLTTLEKCPWCAEHESTAVASASMARAEPPAAVPPPMRVFPGIP